MKWFALLEDNGKRVYLNVSEISSVQEVECANGKTYVSIRMRNGSIFGSTGEVIQEVMRHLFELS